MYVVGTSGHIDHGKTSLIRALTGIDCDRLPEEKEREMTIDIGFARIEYPKFGTVSVIDVPGHERFIRNMVAGAWGIDLALLVVALDDGWMPQTEDHFRVCELLGIERMIVVLNKADLADPDTSAIIGDEVREKLGGTRFEGSDIVRVSAKSGAGIDELRLSILENLKMLANAADYGKPYLFVDRVFASKGHGTVVTGTQKNGVFREGGAVRAVPGGREAKIRKIETHHSGVSASNPSQRTALNLSGIGADELTRGDIILSENFFTETGDILSGIRLLDDTERRNNIGVEILVGASTVKGKLIRLGDEAGGSFIARIRLEREWFFYAGELFILTNPGGYRIIGGGRVLIPRYDKKMKKAVKENIPLLKSFFEPEIVEFILAVYGRSSIDALERSRPQSRNAIKKTLAALAASGKIWLFGDIILSEKYHAASFTSIASAVEKGVGLNLKEIADHAGLDAEVCGLLIKEVVARGGVIEKDGRYFSGSSITVENLPADRKKILDELLAKNTEGIELERLNDEAKKKAVKELIRLGFLVSLDGNIIYHRDVYRGLREKILALFTTREKITVPEAKDAAGLSRKYLIPLLNRIETDGSIKRLGDFRIKV